MTTTNYYLHCMISNKLRTSLILNSFLFVPMLGERIPCELGEICFQKDKGSYTYTSKIGREIMVINYRCMYDPSPTLKE
jgi:hypothetical protein